MASQQQSISIGGKVVLDKLKNLFTNCFEERDCIAGRQGCNQRLSVQNRGRNIRLFRLLRYHPTVHCRQNLGSLLAEWSHPDDSTEKHCRKPVWVQVQQRNRIHDLRAEADTGEMQRTEHRYIYAAFVGLTNSFDTVSRNGLWKFLADIPPPISSGVK